MIKIIRNKAVTQLRKHPVLKNKLLVLIHLYFKVAPPIVSFISRVPAYLKHLADSKVIAKPGTLSFGGGAFNPGALSVEGNHIILLAKSQLIPWFKALRLNSENYLKGNPVVFLLDRDLLKTERSDVITQLIGYPDTDDYEIEDFRLFNWRGRKMINHSVLTKGRTEGNIRLKSVCSALSFLDVDEKTLRFCGIPKLDFPVKKFEKNWVYKENDIQLLLFYSIYPFKVLELKNEKDFSFKTVINKQLTNTINDPGGFGTMVSFSTNPIDFDNGHWLLIIHQVKNKFTGRCYFHWGVLIDKSTLLPTKITSKPLFSGLGARGRRPGIRYISSILKTENEILFFAGEGDVYVTVTKRKIQELQSLFVPL